MTSGARRRGGGAARPEKPPPVTQLPTVNPTTPPPTLPGVARTPALLPAQDPPGIPPDFYTKTHAPSLGRGAAGYGLFPITPAPVSVPPPKFLCSRPPSSAIGSLRASVSLSLLHLYNERKPGDLCTGPPRPTELDLWTGRVWRAVPGDLGRRGPLARVGSRSPGAALGTPGKKKTCLLLPGGVSFEPAPAPVRVSTASPQAVRPVGLRRPRPGRGRPTPPGAAGQATSTGSSTVLSGLVSEAQVPLGPRNSCRLPLPLSRSCLPRPPTSQRPRWGREGFG